MVVVCFIHVIISLFIKILLDDEIDDFLRKNRQKNIAKKRKLKNIKHLQITNKCFKRKKQGVRSRMGGCNPPFLVVWGVWGKSKSPALWLLLAQK